MRATGFSREKAARLLPKYGLDLLILSSPENIFYSSGFPSRHAEHNPTIFDTMNQFPMFVVVGADGEETAIGWDIVSDVPTWIKDYRGIWSRQQSVDCLIQVAKERLRRGGRVGVESMFPLFAYKALSSSLDPQKIIVSDEPLNKMRLVKSEQEISLLRRSATVAEDATMETIDALRPGITDLELLETAKLSMLKRGALGWTGLSLQLPGQSEFAPGTGKKVMRGDVVALDFGAIVDGYSSDLFRQASMGPVPEDARRAFDRALVTQQLCEEKVRPGVEFQEVFSISAANYAKMGGALRSMAGHSIGVQTEETPLIREGVNTTFEENMVITLEFSEWVGKWRIGIEDMYVVRKDGVEKMTRTIPPELFVR